MSNISKGLLGRAHQVALAGAVALGSGACGSDGNLSITSPTLFAKPNVCESAFLSPGDNSLRVLVAERYYERGYNCEFKNLGLASDMCEKLSDIPKEKLLVGIPSLRTGVDVRHFADGAIEIIDREATLYCPYDLNKDGSSTSEDGEMLDFELNIR